MASDAKKLLPGGPTRHAARRAAASFLLCATDWNCRQPQCDEQFDQEKEVLALISKTMPNNEKNERKEERA